MRECCHEMKLAHRDLTSKLSHMVDRFGDLAAGLQSLIDMKVELARKDAEHDANFETALRTAQRAHERLDKFEANITRIVFIILTIVIGALMAGKAFIAGG